MFLIPYNYKINLNWEKYYFKEFQVVFTVSSFVGHPVDCLIDLQENNWFLDSNSNFLISYIRTWKFNRFSQSEFTAHYQQSTTNIDK